MEYYNPEYRPDLNSQTTTGWQPAQVYLEDANFKNLEGQLARDFVLRVKNVQVARIRLSRRDMLELASKLLNSAMTMSD